MKVRKFVLAFRAGPGRRRRLGSGVLGAERLVPLGDVRHQPFWLVAIGFLTALLTGKGLTPPGPS
jgi:hypothetical protein